MKNGFARALVLAWAVASAAFPGVVGLAHALQSDGSAEAVASHVEPVGGQDCLPVHDADCALCSTLRLAGTPGPRPELPVAAGDRATAQRGERVPTVTVADAGRAARPRAPPAL